MTLQDGFRHEQAYLLLFTGVLVACATGGNNPRYNYEKVQVANLAGATITNVSLRITGSPKTLACAEVAKSDICADLFARRPYPQQGIELTWTHPDGSSKSASPDPTIPIGTSSAFPLRIELEINPDGSVKSYIRVKIRGK
ncbi:MAG: hypothetical protein GY896_10370 [Gammaproteobacteria bacterium]|nr:hypothetical protein [Gammaproteobacteria bacterium]